MADEEEDLEAIREGIKQGLATAMPGMMVNRWIVLVETIEQNGDRSVWMQSADDMKIWECLGMLEYAKLAEMAAEVNRDDDD